MSENKKTSVDDLLAQLEKFEEAVNSLNKNIGILKEKLIQNKETYGEDVSKWPQNNL